MAASDFFARWSKAGMPPDRTLSEVAGERAIPAVPDQGSPAPLPPPRALTLEDAAALTADADFKPFMASHVDAGVKRLALKQLFADPHFNVMDGLDTYIEDYNSFVPMDAAMVAALNHGKALLDPLAQLLHPDPNVALATPPPPEPDEPAPLAATPSPPFQTDEQPDSPPATATTAAPASPPSGIHDESLPGL